MRIRVTKPLLDVQERKRPRVGYVFDVIEVKEAKYKPNENNIKIIECCGNRLSVLNDECEILL